MTCKFKNIKYAYTTLKNDENELRIADTTFAQDGLKEMTSYYCIEKAKLFNNYIYQQLSTEELLKMKQAIKEELRLREIKQNEVSDGNQ